MEKIDLGLDRMTRILLLLGNPEATYPIVHVAGTNGKGSTCSLLTAALRYGQARVGTYTSPYLVHPSDSILINSEPVSIEEFEEILSRVSEAARVNEINLTTFELWTTVAFVAFQNHDIDIAIIEVGLGGRTDATNVIPPPLVAINTSICHDHIDLLGPTIADIAEHKAGIFKSGSSCVLTYSLSPEVREICMAVAERNGVHDIRVSKKLKYVSSTDYFGKYGHSDYGGLLNKDRLSFFLDPESGITFRIPLHGEFQRENTSVAYCALSCLLNQSKRMLKLLELIPDELSTMNTSDFIHPSVVRNIEILLPKYSFLSELSVKSLVRGFADVIWHGRLEFLKLKCPSSDIEASISGESDDLPDESRSPVELSTRNEEVLEFLVDGGHNEGAFPHLRSFFDKQLSIGTYKRIVFIYGGSANRPLSQVVPSLFKTGDAVLAVPFSPVQGMPWVRCHNVEAVSSAVRSFCYSSTDSKTREAFMSLLEGEEDITDYEKVVDRLVRDCGSFQEAVSVVFKDTLFRRNDTLRVICGSLYLVADVFRSGLIQKED